MKASDIWFCFSISWFMTRWLGGTALGFTLALIGLSYFQEPSMGCKIIGEILWIIGILFGLTANFTLGFTKEGIKKLKEFLRRFFLIKEHKESQEGRKKCKIQ